MGITCPTQSLFILQAQAQAQAQAQRERERECRGGLDNLEVKDISKMEFLT